MLLLLPAAANLAGVYKDDLDLCDGNELLWCAAFVHTGTFKDEQTEDVSRINFMYHMIDTQKASSIIVSKCRNSTPHVSGADGQ